MDTTTAGTGRRRRVTRLASTATALMLAAGLTACNKSGEGGSFFQDKKNNGHDNGPMPTSSGHGHSINVGGDVATPTVTGPVRIGTSIEPDIKETGLLPAGSSGETATQLGSGGEVSQKIRVPDGTDVLAHLTTTMPARGWKVDMARKGYVTGTRGGKRVTVTFFDDSQGVMTVALRSTS